MLPNYTGRLLDEIILIVVEQTANVKPNPDDTGDYSEARKAALKATAWALFQARNEMQQNRRDAEAIAKQKKASEKKDTPPT